VSASTIAGLCAPCLTLLALGIAVRFFFHLAE